MKIGLRDWIDVSVHQSKPLVMHLLCDDGLGLVASRSKPLGELG